MFSVVCFFQEFGVMEKFVSFPSCLLLLLSMALLSISGYYVVCSGCFLSPWGKKGVKLFEVRVGEAYLIPSS